MEVSPDIHICGLCKQQYNNFEVFLAHKQNGCSLPTSDTSAITTTAPLTGKNTLALDVTCLYSLLAPCNCILSCPAPSSEFVFEETYQTCVVKGVKKILTKAQKTPSKKLKPALTSKRHICCFSGRCLSAFMTPNITHSRSASLLLPLGEVLCLDHIFHDCALFEKFSVILQVALSRHNMAKKTWSGILKPTLVRERLARVVPRLQHLVF